MSKPIRVQGGGTVACPDCGKLCSARGGLSTHRHYSRQCLLTASAAVGIGCQERRRNVGNIGSSVNAPITPAGAHHQPADISHHDSDKADYPNADNEGSDLDDCAAIDHGNSQSAVASQQGVIESLKVKYQAYLNLGFGQAKISKELKTKIDLLVMLQKARAPHYLTKTSGSGRRKLLTPKLNSAGLVPVPVLVSPSSIIVTIWTIPSQLPYQ